MGDQIAPCETLTLQLYQLEHTTFIFLLPQLPEEYMFITHLCRISMTFLPPRCSTSLPMCNNGFYSSFSKKKSHRGQREGQHLTELLSSAATAAEVLQTSHSDQAWMESCVTQERRDPQKCGKPFAALSPPSPSLNSRSVVESSPS